jgi:TM2 domain-containing membrane protein YozV
MFCKQCGSEMENNATFCNQCGAPARQVSGSSSSKRVGAGVFGILFGSLGIHKFYLGYNREGLIMLLVSILSCGIAASVFSVIGFIEGILYLTKSDEEFEEMYVRNYKGWF